MFKTEKREFTFKEFPARKMDVLCRRDTLDYDILKVANEYEFDKIEIPNWGTIVDLGSYTGGEMLWFIARGKPLNYFCFEPLPENWELLAKNMKMNNKDLEIKTFQIAVGGDTKMVKMHYGDLNYKKEGGQWGKMYRFMGDIKKPYRGKDFVEVYQITLDKLFIDNGIEHCNLLKMDVEGHELEILESASLETLCKIDWIIGEYHSPIKREDLLEQTKGLFLDVPYKKKSKSGYLFRFKRNVSI